jgi:hypothetical protein
MASWLAFCLTVALAFLVGVLFDGGYLGAP